MSQLGLVRVAPLKNVPKIIKTKIQFQNGISVDENDENFRREEIISDLNPFPELVFDVTEENRCKNTCDYDNSMKNIEEIDIKIENIIGKFNFVKIYIFLREIYLFVC